LAEYYRYFSDKHSIEDGKLKVIGKTFDDPIKAAGAPSSQ